MLLKKITTIKKSLRKELYKQLDHHVFNAI